MLIEAQLGPNPMYVRETAEYEAESSCKKAKMLATWGVGRTQPAVSKEAHYRGDARLIVLDLSRSGRTLGNCRRT